MTINSKTILTLIGFSVFCGLFVAMADFSTVIATDLIASSVSLVIG